MGAILSRTRLKNIDPKIPIFDFNGYSTIARIVNIYDGDTCHVIFRRWRKVIRLRIRMAHYDSPEIKAKNEPERLKAQDAKNYFTKLLEKSDFYVRVYFGKNDKWGRPLATFYGISKLLGRNKGTSINEKMLETVHAEMYEGGKKSSW